MYDSENYSVSAKQCGYDHDNTEKQEQEEEEEAAEKIRKKAEWPSEWNTDSLPVTSQSLEWSEKERIDGSAVEVPEGKGSAWLLALVERVA